MAIHTSPAGLKWFLAPPDGKRSRPRQERERPSCPGQHWGITPLQGLYIAFVATAPSVYPTTPTNQRRVLPAQCSWGTGVNVGKQRSIHEPYSQNEQHVYTHTRSALITCIPTTCLPAIIFPLQPTPE
ncbi:hypothetical protein BaRGS_00013232 [Batillaria attramentaria]|uniref:Uncharacterized protein n=1 Tax=Batillaria attramentaria TaxID=370345 RepID=A0ABD0L8U5_9CAEN